MAPGPDTLTLDQVALKERGIDKLVEDAREDNKDNDAAFLGRKKCELFRVASRLTLTCWAGAIGALDSGLDGVPLSWIWLK
jgi:hypothetical protein